jgi:hypothetical protein
VSTHAPASPRSLVVAQRFRGPRTSGNGGYTCGLLAAVVAAQGQPVTVTLREPPPLETPMQVDVVDGMARMTFGGALIAEATIADHVPDPVDGVPYELAVAAEAAYDGLRDHPFPGCFVCGTNRDDGLTLRPGWLPSRPGHVATGWTPAHSLLGPSGRIAPEHVWAALDCPGGWSANLAGRPMVLGRMTAQVDACPEAGDRCVVVGRRLSAQGRKTFTASTAYDGEGRILGRADAVWITVDPSRVDS